jgi:hypothetical protein
VPYLQVFQEGWRDDLSLREKAFSKLEADGSNSEVLGRSLG